MHINSASATPSALSVARYRAVLVSILKQKTAR